MTLMGFHMSARVSFSADIAPWSFNCSSVESGHPTLKEFAHSLDEAMIKQQPIAGTTAEPLQKSTACCGHRNEFLGPLYPAPRRRQTYSS